MNANDNLSNDEKQRNEELKKIIRRIKSQYGLSDVHPIKWANGFDPSEYHNFSRFITGDAVPEEIEGTSNTIQSIALEDISEGDFIRLGYEFACIDFRDADSGRGVSKDAYFRRGLPNTGLEFRDNNYFKLIEKTPDRLVLECHGSISRHHRVLHIETDDPGYKSCIENTWVVTRYTKRNIFFRKVQFTLEAMEYVEEMKDLSEKRFQHIVDMAESVYPGRVDGGLCSHYEPASENDCLKSKLDGFGYVLIHFPEVEVRNEKAMVHTITDMYILVTFKADLSIFNYYGIRMSAEAKELNVGYTHSHMSGGFESFSGFCTGSGSFSNTLAVLKTGYDEELLDVFFYYIRIYLEWESLSGGPYKRIEYAISGTTGSSTRYLGIGDCKEIVRFIKDQMDKEVKDKWSARVNDYGQGKFEIIIDGSKPTAEFLKKMSERTVPDTSQQPLLSVLNKSWVYVSTRDVELGALDLNKARSVARSDRNNSRFKFKSEEVSFRAYVDESLYQESYETPIVDLNPALKEFIESIFKRQLVFSLMDDAKKNHKISNTHHEFKKQNKKVGEDFLTCTTIY